MGDEAFLRAILARPEDDLPRLVYADWLDERGDPRGEWLRLQVRLNRLVAYGRSYRPLLNHQRQLEQNAEVGPAWRAAVSYPDRTGTVIRDWQEFYDELFITPMHGEPAPKPTVAQLDAFEARAGFRLPQSYRSYVSVFGPGELLGAGWKIGAPGYQVIAAVWDLDQFHQAYNPCAWLPDHFPVPEHDRIRRCYYFGYKYKDAFGWDPVEVTDADAPEYAVYHMTEEMEVVRVADSFRGFVEWAADWMRGFSDSQWDEEECGPRMSFSPASLSER